MVHPRRPPIKYVWNCKLFVLSYGQPLLGQGLPASLLVLKSCFFSRYSKRADKKRGTCMSLHSYVGISSLYPCALGGNADNSEKRSLSRVAPHLGGKAVRVLRNWQVEDAALHLEGKGI